MWPDIPVNGIVLGQILSLLVTCTSSISTELALSGASIPFTQGAVQYALLFLAFAGPVRLFRWRWHQPAWKYMLVSGIDVLSTGCIVKAFSLTSVTSVTLLDSWTIPCVILLTAVFFRQIYTIKQVASAGIAVSGLIILLAFDDTNDSSSSGRTSTLMGDALVIAGATGYAANNVLTEHILKTGEAAELLGGMGCFGIIASAVLVPLTESQAISEITWTWSIIAWLVAYGAALFLFSLGMPILLHRSGSTVFNLSLLTSDFYAFAVRGVFFEGFSRKSLGVYLISCAAVVSGLVIYFTSPDAPQQAPPQATTNAANYTAVDLYDAYASPDGFQACAPEQTGSEGRMRLSDDGSVLDHAPAASCVNGSCRRCGSRAGTSEAGSSPIGRAVVSCQVMGGTASVVSADHARCGGEMPSGLEMTSSDGQIAWEHGDNAAAGVPTSGPETGVAPETPGDGAVLPLDDA